ncbi:MAG: response regulator transcription factor [OCS116 cluster bacterium]|uniref:DNA-binding response regulator n=1 Tax=OCS116 cluster bacterium TaxID=2030921 RepID=A0A2A4Z7I3_9PROT|nr:response regulator transcription factor [OCS116 cluster bacterium]
MVKKVVIADDHPLFRAALKQAIRKISTNAKIMEVSSLGEASDILAGEDNINLLLLDIHMSDSDGFAGLIMYKQAYPLTPIVIVSASEEPEIIRNAIEFGASGFIPKSADLSVIREAINTVFEGQSWWPEVDGLSKLGRNGRIGFSESSKLFSTLTPTQSKVFMAIAEGLLNKQIAFKMDISESTIKTHITAIFKKLNISSRTQAVIFAKDLEKNTKQD